jgi:hypothetical protein
MPKRIVLAVMAVMLVLVGVAFAVPALLRTSAPSPSSSAKANAFVPGSSVLAVPSMASSSPPGAPTLADDPPAASSLAGATPSTSTSRPAAVATSRPVSRSPGMPGRSGATQTSVPTKPTKPPARTRDDDDIK